MRLVKKLGLVFLCCFPAGIITSGCELSFREEFKKSSSFLLVDDFLDLDEVKKEEEVKSNNLEDVQIETSFDQKELNQPIATNENKNSEESLSTSKDLQPENNKRLSDKEQKVRKFIGVGSGPITGEKVKAGLLKLHSRRSRLNAEESYMYVTLVDILSQFMKFKKMIKPL